MQTHLAVVAEFASEEDDGKLTIAGIFDEIRSTEIPCTLPRVYVVAQLDARVVEGSEHTVHITIVDADGNHVVNPPPPIPVAFVPGSPGHPLKARIIAQIDTVSFRKEGDYEVALRVDGEHVVSLPIRVSLRQPA